MPKLTLRVSEELNEELAELAKREQRSVHAQILYLLQRALEAERQAALKENL